MKQAIHIFLKDARRLWIQIALLWVAIGYFVWADIRLELHEHGGGDQNLPIEMVVCGLVWLLIARAVHEESLTGENQFWLTRPYERGSLLYAKILMLLVAIIAPLFVADCVIVGAQSLSLTGNFGGLLLRQLITAFWLVIPPFAIASVTRSITEDVLAWVGFVAIAGMTYFAAGLKGFFAVSNETYWLVLAVALTIVVLWRQYLRRGVALSRAILAAAVLIPALPFPDTGAVAIEHFQNDPETSGISIAMESGAETESIAGYNSLSCVRIPAVVSGLRPGWRLMPLSQKNTFRVADAASVSTDSSAVGTGNWWRFDACTPSDTLKELGPGKKLALHVSMVLGVVARDQPRTIRATPDAFDVPGVGRCEFRIYPVTVYGLMCASPIWAPATGMVSFVGAADSRVISNIAYPVMPFRMLPGLSPVYKWTTLTADSQIRDALKNGGTLEFRPESQIAVIQREFDVRDVEF